MRSNNTSKSKGKSSKNNNSNVWKLVIFAVAVIALAIVFLNRPKWHYVDGYTGQVKEVVDGNTIVLRDGLTVDLLGIDNTDRSRRFLAENIQGREVVLRADSRDPQPRFKRAENTTVRAYVRVVGPVEYAQINGYMLKKGMSDFNSQYCNDSSAVFSAYVDPNIGKYDDNAGSKYVRNGREMTSEALGYHMTPSTILIVSSGGIGTGFFINERGLALTNYHVIEALGKYKDFTVFLCDSTGKVYTDQDRQVGRVLEYSEEYDFAVFTVLPDAGERFPYLPLAQNRPERGTKIGVVGHPNGDLAKYTAGQVSSINEAKGEIGLDVAITNGNSGGPVCNMYGEVVAIAKSTAKDQYGIQNSANLNYGVDIMVVRQMLDNLKADIAKDYAGKN